MENALNATLISFSLQMEDASTRTNTVKNSIRMENVFNACQHINTVKKCKNVSRKLRVAFMTMKIDVFLVKFLSLKTQEDVSSTDVFIIGKMAADNVSILTELPIEKDAKFLTVFLTRQKNVSDVLKDMPFLLKTYASSKINIVWHIIILELSVWDAWKDTDLIEKEDANM